MEKRLVRDWMTPDPITVHPQQTLPQAHNLMKTKNVRRLPVVEDDRLVGIVTFGDIREAQPSDASSLSSYEASYLVGLMSIDSIMTPDPYTIEADAPIAEAARAMLQHKIGGIPVVNADGNLVGIITETDICRVVLACAI
ncbi:MAG TPA: CBS domain-containing protein [Anaerolineales bacterium]|nr:CBS domain-containing protein [Anaerolineales bacterium]